MKSFLITGGAGFIGSHLADFLIKAGHPVTVLDDLSSGRTENLSEHCKFIKGSITDRAMVAKACQGIDACFHLAAVASVQQSIHDWEACHQVNLVGSINIFQEAARCGFPVIYASSAAVYGDPASVPIKEESVIKPLSPYGFDKYSTEYQAMLSSRLLGLSSVGLRFFNVFGPRQLASSPYSGVISVFADQLSLGKTLTIYGDGKQQRDFIYVSDVVKALYQAYQYASSLSDACGVFNVCSAVATEINALADTICGLLGRAATIEYQDPRVGDIRQSVGCAALAKAELGFSSQTSLLDGLKKMLDA